MDTNDDGAEAISSLLSVGAAPVLSAQVRKELVDTLHARTNYDKAKAEEELVARDIREEFLLRFGDLGLKPDNLPDLFAAHLMAMWSVVHDAPLPAADAAEGLRRQFVAQIMTSPIATDAAKRQLVGEALMYEAVLTLEAHRVARDAGDKAKLRQMADSAQAALLRQRGINLRKTRLTAAGMTRA